MKNDQMIGMCLVVVSLSMVVTSRAATMRELRDGRYWINVPAGETYTLAADDVDVLVPEAGGQPELWKIGAGTLEMTTNGLANCAKMMSYNADIYATNGLLRTLSEYALGNYTKNSTTENSQTFIWPGAAYDNGYQRDENSTGKAAGGITQREMIHISGDGFGEYSALNETVGNHIMIGKVTLDGDARVGKSGRTTNVRYHLLDFNGHQITTAGGLGFGSLQVANVPAVPLVVSSGHYVAFTGTGLISTEPEHTICLENYAQFTADGLNGDSFLWTLAFVSNGTIRVQNVSSSATIKNTWNGPITVGPGGKLSVSFNNSNHPLTLNKAITGGCTLEVTSDGTLTLGADRHLIRRVVLNGANRKLCLPDEFVLEVQSLAANGVELPEGDYTTENLANIVSGTVRVNPNAQILDSSQTCDDYTVRSVGSLSAPQVTVGASGACSIVAEGNSTAEMTFTGLDALLGRARFHVDACAATSITYVAEETWTSANGLRGVSRWQSVNADNLSFNNFKLTPEWNSAKTTQFRYVSAYPTVQDYTVNGVTRPYMDMGELDGATNTGERHYSNSFSVSPTTAGMQSGTYDGPNSVLAGLEYHTVFGDAHPNPTNQNRMALFGRGNCLDNDSSEYLPGRRGSDGMLFAQTDRTTEAFRDGRIWADNVATNSTYAPAWGDVHVYTVIPTNAFTGATHPNFSRCYMIGVDSYARYGGARYGEMLVYADATNTAAERARIDAYLMRKWLGKGPGAEMAFDTVMLTNHATLALSCPAYADIGSGFRIGTLKGDGTLSVGEKDALFVANLAFGFTGREACEAITTRAPVTFAESGTITLTLTDGRRPKNGTYTIFTAPNAVNVEALDAWRVVCPERGVLVRRSGTTLAAEVTSGLVVIMR